MLVGEQFWEDLLACLEERRVIPIVGPELSWNQRDDFARTASSHRLSMSGVAAIRVAHDRLSKPGVMAYAVVIRLPHPVP